MATSDDGGRVAFMTAAPLVAEDTGSGVDVYLNDHGAITRVSQGSATLAGTTPDLTHIYFSTSQSLVPEDTGTSNDLYEWAAGVTRLVSIGDSGAHGALCFESTDGPCLSKPGAVSDDGSHVFFESTQQLTSNDPDTAGDIYVRSGGTTCLVSTAGRREQRLPRRVE